MSRHCFSTGPHHDPARLGAGPLIGLDEHLIAPGRGFADHAHRGVTIVSYVVSGDLLHRGGTKEVAVAEGGLLVQSCGPRIRHSEMNASDATALRLLQMTVLVDEDAATMRARSPVTVGLGELVVAVDQQVDAASATFVVSGTATVAGEPVTAGDLVLTASGVAEAHGTSLVWRWPP